MSTSGKTLLSSKEVAHELGQSVSQIYKLTTSGKLRSVRIGRRPMIRVSDLEAYVEAHATGQMHPPADPRPRPVRHDDAPPITDSEMKRRQRDLMAAFDQAGYLLSVLTLGDWIKRRDR